MTSSSASAGGACTGTGVAPTRIQGVIGVSKAYITRVGGGPFPTEAFDHTGEQIRSRGNEFGAVTGRPRRCGWFDVPLLRYTAAINGFDSLVVTKLDVLDALDQIPVCASYRVDGVQTCEMPPPRRLECVEPVSSTSPAGNHNARLFEPQRTCPAARDHVPFLQSAPASRSAACPQSGTHGDHDCSGSRLEEL